MGHCSRLRRSHSDRLIVAGEKFSRRCPRNESCQDCPTEELVKSLPPEILDALEALRRQLRANENSEAANFG